MHVLSYAALALAACASQTLAFVPAGPLSGMASSSKRYVKGRRKEGRGVGRWEGEGGEVRGR